ncbi:MAG: Macrolide-specific efflux protein MacA, partial [Candidatus Wolfebacteria bacterium GW2011_GWA2_47_9b]
MNKLIKQLKILLGKTISLAKTRPVWFSLGVIAVSILTVFALGNRNTLADYDVESVGRRDVVNLVDVTGKVNSPDKVDLGLERGGKIAKIEVGVGDEVKAGKTLVITNNSDLWAGLEEAQANLAVEKLNLEEIRETSVLDESSAFTDLVNTLQGAHTSVEDAIENKLSEIFRGSASSKQIGITSDFGT